MNRRLLLSALAALAACGCSGGTVTTPPVVTPTPTPTPPPTVAIRGEARMLSGVAPVGLLYRAARVRAVYSFGIDGRRIDYDLSDYAATAMTIARTPGSRISDYGSYSYVRSSGDKFDLISSRATRR